MEAGPPKALVDVCRCTPPHLKIHTQDFARSATLSTVDTLAWATRVVAEAVRLRGLRTPTGRRINSASGLYAALGMSEYRAQLVHRRRVQDVVRSAKRAPVRDEEGDGYTLEGRFAIHVSEEEIDMPNFDRYQPAGSRRDRLGRSRCPFDPPREREPLNFRL